VFMGNNLRSELESRDTGSDRMTGGGRVNENGCVCPEGAPEYGGGGDRGSAAAGG
jgi:hypothetical protein